MNESKKRRIKSNTRSSNATEILFKKKRHSTVHTVQRADDEVNARATYTLMHISRMPVQMCERSARDCFDRHFDHSWSVSIFKLKTQTALRAAE